MPTDKKCRIPHFSAIELANFNMKRANFNMNPK